MVPATDYCILIAILSDPNYAFGVYKNFQAVHIFKHYKLHVASFGDCPSPETYHA